MLLLSSMQWSCLTQEGSGAVLTLPMARLHQPHHVRCCREGLKEVVDAIVTDPPYGVRAGARKSVHLPYKTRVPGRDHFPHTDPYTLAECLADLLESAARLLRVGGRLVYFLPVTSRCHILLQSPEPSCSQQRWLSGGGDRAVVNDTGV